MYSIKKNKNKNPLFPLMYCSAKLELFPTCHFHADALQSTQADSGSNRNSPPEKV